MLWGTGGKAASLALSPSPWVCKTAASAGAGVCPLGHRHSPRQSQPGQQRGIPRAALKHVRAPSSHWEEVLVLQDGFERSFCSLGGSLWEAALSHLCKAEGRCHRQHVPSLPFLLAFAARSARLQPPRCSAAAGRAGPAQPAPERQPCACPASECPCCPYCALVLTRNNETPVLCRNGKVLTVVK